MAKTVSAGHRLMALLGGVFGLILSYAFITRAFTTGSYWHYFFSLVFLVLGAKLLVRSLKKRK
jgi:hypothetical protein